MMKMRTKVMKTLSIHKHLFLYYPPDLVKTEQLMKFSITIQDLTGHKMKFCQLMSLTHLDIWHEHSLHFTLGESRILMNPG